MNTDNAGVLVAMVVPGIGTLWRAASLRGDANKEWTPRVDDAEVALADRATQQLVAMQAEIAHLLAAGGTLAVPISAISDPSVLSERAQDFQTTLAARAGLARNFRRLLRIGPMLIVASTIYLVGWLLFGADDTELLESFIIQTAGIAALCGGLVFGIALIFAYVVLHQRLSGAEIRAATPIPSSGAPSRKGRNG